MLAVTANRWSPSDKWRKCSDEKTKERAMLGCWRDPKMSKESQEVKKGGGSKWTSDNWRVGKQEGAKEVDNTGVHGSCLPEEWKLQKIYKHLKIDTNSFLTWLVESVYPSTESLPCYITLSPKQAKNHPKYEIITNDTPQLARQIRTVPPSILVLLDRVIDERTEYSHWMSQKETDAASGSTNETHLYYIEVLKEVRIILTERIGPDAKTAPRMDSPTTAETPSPLIPTRKPTLGKRKNSTSKIHESDRSKAAKTKPAVIAPELATDDGAGHPAKTPMRQKDDWRRVIADSRNNMGEKKSATGARPGSSAAALHVAITA